MEMCYAIVIERGGQNYSAYVPDLPGCVATGATIAEVEAEMREAIAFHLEGLRADGLPAPEPSSEVRYLGVAA
ncbi:MAG TPA: type II toxin-antitoxin system HicB family antitoxin [Burkholderiaceae bacterium]|jgi:predicted RNase H-like HicB family nuclease|nr:type II toxin-antitoxin system HicB family antitoxin [Burkholderiaceae bacterium]